MIMHLFLVPWLNDEITKPLSYIPSNLGQEFSKLSTMKNIEYSQIGNNFIIGHSLTSKHEDIAPKYSFYDWHALEKINQSIICPEQG